jgi:predicted kinase
VINYNYDENPNGDRYEGDPLMLNTVYVLVGMPGVGKSTWINKNYHHLPVVSSDNFIELMARNQNKTYNEVFQQYIKLFQTPHSSNAKNTRNRHNRVTE